MNTKESFIIEGLAGEKKLNGTVEINGAKNSALKAMVASVLFDGPVVLNNIPNTDDIHTMTEVLKKLGASVSWQGDSGSKTLLIDASNFKSTDIDIGLAKTMRASVVLTGPLLARFHKVTFPAPGGCVIGARPIDLFTSGYEKMGASVTLNDSNCLYDMKTTKSLNGTEIFFEKISVGATETLMMTAVLAKGKTVLKNCAMEPEIGNVAMWLNECGANIKGIGTSTLEIEGTAGKLLSPKKPFVTIPDRIEAGSFLILGALCAKDLVIKNCCPEHLESVISVLKDSGVPIKTTVGKDGKVGEIIIYNNYAKNSTFKPFNVKTQEYPGFPTDLQAQMVTYLTQVSGESGVLETIFEGRFKYVEDLINMGANIISMNPREILVKGPTLLRQLPDDEELNAHDIRAGFAVVLAALVGEGKFKVNNIHLIDRGYEKLEEKLKALGADIRR
ncbi:MAG: UDP-N-acetylglucosamine 1-carboxyvinyltransferase [Candidatus Paceibacterota bacterium]|jgi:UDP-N-acetylglucosamine 1-carboxyvinyltransferase